MTVTRLPEQTYRETVAAIVYRYEHPSKKHERIGGLEILLVGRGPEFGWPAEWLDFPGGGVEEQIDYNPSPEKMLENAVLRELSQELGRPTNEFSSPLYTGITRIAPFRSESSIMRHQDYSGKKIFYLTVEYTGRKEAIWLHDRLTIMKWVPYMQLAESVRPETTETAKKIMKLNRPIFFDHVPTPKIYRTEHAAHFATTAQKLGPSSEERLLTDIALSKCRVSP